ncbi:MAG: LysR family transcriptional regulator [Frankiales bacterium]|nr:LysR family transcriptional regulator [Frankiales bacterium]
MTPSQLRAFTAVARNGSVKDAAVELGVTESAVSLQVGALRKELDDQLFARTASGLAFTPGGLRLASRASEMLGLQDQTVREVNQARQGRRLLRIVSTSLFAEHCAPGMIELFLGRADDFDVELSVRQDSQFGKLLASRALDVAIGPELRSPEGSFVCKPFLKYEIVAVVGPGHPLTTTTASARKQVLREQTWLLGPSATGSDGAVSRLLRQFDVPEDRQRIFQSHAAALEEAKRGSGIAFALSFAISADLTRRRLVLVRGPGLPAEGTWSTMTLPEHSLQPAVAELTRFISTPRAIQAMLRGSGVNVGHFRPSIHVTLWK